jgi:predicted AlkP superfamily pyrophosphatase or phosphodiesterase
MLLADPQTMMPNRFRVILAAVAFALFALTFAAPVRMAAQQPPRSRSPKLIVILVADQMRFDYLERYSQHFTGGLERLMQDGAWFQHAAYPYLNTVTCPGHSTIGTGTLPYQHGMILNTWFDRKKRAPTDCTDDETTKEISYNNALSGPGDSGRRQLRPTLADRVREQAHGRVVTLSMKARSAIGLAGHGGDVVLWFDTRGGFTTSSAYAHQTTEFVRKYIDDNPVTAAYGRQWARLYDPAVYENKDDDPFEKAPSGWTRTFPHIIGSKSGKPDGEFYSHWMGSPLSDAYLGKLAAAAIETIQLGKGSSVDFLGVSFSALDLVGHAFGPNSHEVQDVVARLDVTIGDLLNHLDASVGAGNYVLGFSADHGVGDIPEEVQGGRYTAAVTSGAVDKALAPFSHLAKNVAYVAYTDLYLEQPALKSIKKNAAARAAVLDALRALPGIAAAFTADEVATAAARRSTDPVMRAAALSYHEGRSGDLIIVPREHWLLSTSATSHGTLYPYDQRVPIILYGAGVRKGVYSDQVMPADIAPSLAALAGIQMTGTDGHALSEAFAHDTSR